MKLGKMLIILAGLFGVHFAKAEVSEGEKVLSTYTKLNKKNFLETANASQDWTSSK